MKNTNLFSSATVIAILLLVVIGCDMGPSRVDKLTISKDEAGSEAATAFKTDEPIHAKAVLTSFSGKAKVKGYMTAEEDMDGLKKGEVIKGTEKTIEINSDEAAQFTFTLTNHFPSGKYAVIAEVLKEDGKIQDSKRAEIAIEKVAESDAP